MQTAIPTPKPNEVLVKIQASGCCHTDLHAIEGKLSLKANLPLCPGHEGVGQIELVRYVQKNAVALQYCSLIVMSFVS